MINVVNIRILLTTLGLILCCLNASASDTIQNSYENAFNKSTTHTDGSYYDLMKKYKSIRTSRKLTTRFENNRVMEEVEVETEGSLGGLLTRVQGVASSLLSLLEQSLSILGIDLPDLPFGGDTSLSFAPSETPRSPSSNGVGVAAASTPLGEQISSFFEQQGQSVQDSAVVADTTMAPITSPVTITGSPSNPPTQAPTKQPSIPLKASDESLIPSTISTLSLSEPGSECPKDFVGISVENECKEASVSLNFVYDDEGESSTSRSATIGCCFYHISNDNAYFLTSSIGSNKCIEEGAKTDRLRICAENVNPKDFDSSFAHSSFPNKIFQYNLSLLGILLLLL